LAPPGIFIYEDVLCFVKSNWPPFQQFLTFWPLSFYTYWNGLVLLFLNWTFLFLLMYWKLELGIHFFLFLNFISFTILITHLFSDVFNYLKFYLFISFFFSYSKVKFTTQCSSILFLDYFISLLIIFL
jgi:hypothetical protein